MFWAEKTNLSGSEAREGIVLLAVEKYQKRLEEHHSGDLRGSYQSPYAKFPGATIWRSYTLLFLSSI